MSINKHKYNINIIGRNDEQCTYGVNVYKIGMASMYSQVTQNPKTALKSGEPKLLTKNTVL